MVLGNLERGVEEGEESVMIVELRIKIMLEEKMGLCFGDFGRLWKVMRQL